MKKPVLRRKRAGSLQRRGERKTLKKKPKQISPQEHVAAMEKAAAETQMDELDAIDIAIGTEDSPGETPIALMLDDEPPTPAKAPIEKKKTSAKKPPKAHKSSRKSNTPRADKVLKRPSQSEGKETGSNTGESKNVVIAAPTFVEAVKPVEAGPLGPVEGNADSAKKKKPEEKVVPTALSSSPSVSDTDATAAMAPSSVDDVVHFLQSLKQQQATSVQRNEELLEQNRNMQASLERANLERDQYETLSRELRKDLDRANEEVARLKKVDENLQAAQTEKEQLLQEKKEFEEEISDLQDLAEHAEKIEDELVKLKEKNAEDEERISTFELDVNTLQEQVATEQQARNSLEKDLALAKSQLKQIKELISS